MKKLQLHWQIIIGMLLGIFFGIFSFYFVGAVTIENEPDRLPGFLGDENLRKFENSIK